jgi:tRNA U34 2-thiouridine synthase MnmA/TrmU
VNMLDAVSPDEMLEAQYRYHGPKIIGTYDSEENIFTPSATLHTSIAQGQSLVLYRGSTCVGGGIIV